MASRTKKKTTFAKLAREQKLRERRQDKRAKKEARKRAGGTDLEPLQDPTQPGDPSLTLNTDAQPAGSEVPRART